MKKDNKPSVLDKVLKVAEDHVVLYYTDRAPIVIKSLKAAEIAQNVINFGPDWYETVDILPAGNKRVV